MLQQLHDDLWTVAVPHDFMGVLAFGARSTIARLPDGRLWVHSPIPLTDDLRAEVAALGPVGEIVCPNLFHHLYAGQWADAWPDAHLYGPPGLADKRSDLTLHGQLEDTAPDAWGGVLRVRAVCDRGPLRETIFLHEPAGTLIVTDLVLNLHDAGNAFTGFYLWALRARGKVCTSAAIKPAIKDRARARRVVDEVLGWEWDRLVMSHGEIVQTGGRDALRQGLAWL